MNIIVLPHQGLGDQIIINGYINHLLLDESINNIILIAKIYQEKTLRHLYSDSPRVSFYWIEAESESTCDEEWSNIPLLKSINKKPFNSKVVINNETYSLHTFGMHSDIKSFIIKGRNWADSFYLRADVDPSLRYTLFKPPSNLELSKNLYMLLKEQIQTDKYILVHDDPSRGRVIHPGLVKSILDINSTKDLPVIYLGKNRNNYPFIEGLHNIGLDEIFSSGSLLNLYHIILHATECHFMDSSIACLTDTMDNKDTKLYLHYYLTETAGGCAGDSVGEVHLRRKWTSFHA